MKEFRRRARCLPRIEALEPRRMLAVTFSNYALPSGMDATSITQGPDKNLWFTLRPGAIGSINPSTDAISVYPFQSPVGYPQSIVSVPGGDLWFLDGPNIGSIDPATHAITLYPKPNPQYFPYQLALGSDGNLWYTDQANAAIGVFNVSVHTFTEFALPVMSDNPRAITGGPDGNLWFGLIEDNGTITEAFGDINPTSHAITLTNLPNDITGVTAITSGPDGNLWFNTESVMTNGPYEIGSINPTTRAVNLYQGGGGGGITNGPDGNIYFDQLLGEFNLTSLVATTFQRPGTWGPSINGITTGPDGNLWLTSQAFTGEGYIQSAHIIPASQAAVAGYVYLDATGSRPNSLLANATVYLDLKGDGRLDPGDPTANSDALGYYAITGLTPGTYTARLAPYPGNIATSPNDSTQTVTVAGGQLGSPAQLGLLPTSAVIPLTYDLGPFGAHNPDDQTAEVVGLYRLILGRAPDASGGAAAIAYLKNGGSVAALAGGLLHSPEYETNVVASYYRTYLRRAGSSSEVAGWVASIQAGATQEQVAADFLDSAEYSALFPADATFVQALYGDVLGRLPMASEVSGWLAAIAAGASRAQVVGDFLGSIEAAGRGADGLYGIIFARAPDSTSAATALQGGLTLVDLATSFFGSAEFTSRADSTVG